MPINQIEFNTLEVVVASVIGIIVVGIIFYFFQYNFLKKRKEEADKKQKIEEYMCKQSLGSSPRANVNSSTSRVNGSNFSSSNSNNANSSFSGGMDGVTTGLIVGTLMSDGSNNSGHYSKEPEIVQNQLNGQSQVQSDSISDTNNWSGIATGALDSQDGVVKRSWSGIEAPASSVESVNAQAAEIVSTYAPSYSNDSGGDGSSCSSCSSSGCGGD